MSRYNVSMPEVFFVFAALVVLEVVESLPLPEAPSNAIAVVLAAALCPFVTIAMAARLGRRIRARATRGGDTWFREPALARARIAIHVIALASFAGIAFLTDWPALPRLVFRPEVLILPHAIAIAPYILALVTGMALLARVEASLAGGGQSWGRRAWLDLRPALVIIGLLLLLNIAHDARWIFPLTYAHLATAPGPRGVLLVLLSAALLLFAPFALRLLWPTTPFPPGVLLDRMHALLPRARIRCRDIRIWHTGARPIFTALIAGAAGPFRAVFFTDVLVRALADDEVEQVFAHELGHARLNHLLVYFAIVLSCFFSLLAVATWVMDPPVWMWGACLIVMALYLWFFLGTVSRQLESEADLYGAELTGSPENALACLARAAQLAGGAAAERRGWRHHSIAQRMAILTAAQENPESRRRFKRRTRLLIGLVFLCLVASTSLLVHAAWQKPEAAACRERAELLLSDYNERLRRPGRAAAREEELLGAAEAELEQAARLLGDAGEPRANQHAEVLERLANVRKELLARTLEEN